MQGHHGEARDNGYVVVPLHVPFGGHRRWLKLSTKEELAAKAKNGSFGGCPRLF